MSIAAAVTAAIVVVMLGAGASALASYLNRRDLRVLTAAERCVRDRLGQREDFSIDDLVRDAGIPDDERARGKALLDDISHAMGTSAGKLRAGDRLGDLVTVSRGELPVVPDAIWKKVGGEKPSVQVFGHDLLWVLERRGGARRLAATRALMGSQCPVNEDEWVTWMLSQTVGGLLRVVTTLDPTRQKSRGPSR